MPLVCTHILCVDVLEVKWGDWDGGLGRDSEYMDSRSSFRGQGGWREQPQMQRKRKMRFSSSSLLPGVVPLRPGAVHAGACCRLAGSWHCFPWTQRAGTIKSLRCSGRKCRGPVTVLLSSYHSTLIVILLFCSSATLFSSTVGQMSTFWRCCSLTMTQSSSSAIPTGLSTWSMFTTIRRWQKTMTFSGLFGNSLLILRCLIKTPFCSKSLLAIKLSAPQSWGAILTLSTRVPLNNSSADQAAHQTGRRSRRAHLRRHLPGRRRRGRRRRGFRERERQRLGAVREAQEIRRSTWWREKTHKRICSELSSACL